MKLSSTNIKKCLIFSLKKAFLIFWKTKTPIKFLIFQETELFDISRNGNPKKLLKFKEIKIQTKKKKKKEKKKKHSEKILIFREMELCSPKKLKKTF